MMPERPLIEFDAAMLDTSTHALRPGANLTESGLHRHVHSVICEPAS